MPFPVRISELILSSEAQKFKTPDFLSLVRPGVYLFTKGDTALYVGYSKRILQRLGGYHHHFQSLLQSDEILIYPTATEADAIELEELLIEHLKPKHNIRKRYTRRMRQLGLSGASLQSYGIRVESARRQSTSVISEQTEIPQTPLTRAFAAAVRQDGHEVARSSEAMVLER